MVFVNPDLVAAPVTKDVLLHYRIYTVPNVKASLKHV